MLQDSRCIRHVTNDDVNSDITVLSTDLFECSADLDHILEKNLNDVVDGRSIGPRNILDQAASGC